MNRIIVFIVILALLLASGLSFAATDAYQFKTPQQRAQFNELIQTLRCLVCQNQNLADSNAALAQDLRQEVYEMVIQDKSSTEIKQYLVARYGDFVLYKPPFQFKTLLLWIGPFAVLIIAFSYLFYRVRKQRSINPETDLTAEEQQRLKRIVGG